MTTDPTTIPSVEDLQKTKGYMEDINDFVSSEDNSLVDNDGKTRKTLTGITNESESKIEEAVENTGYYVVFDFTTGGTITARNQLVRDTTDGKLYKWGGDIPENGYVVPPASTPTPQGENAWRYMADNLQSLAGLQDPSDLDTVYDRSFNNVNEMLSYTGHTVGLKYCTGSTVWKVKSVPVVDISDFERLNQLNVIDFGAQFGTSDSSAAFLDAAQVDGSSVFVPSGTFNCGTTTDFSQYDFHSVGDVNILNNLTINVKDITKSYRHNGDLLQKIRSQLGIRGMYYYSDASNLFVGIGMNKQLDSVVEYRFEVNPDGLLLIKGGFAGIGDESLSTKTATLNGTFIESSPANGSYTITVGDKVNGSFTGSHFGLNHYGDNRGGIWKITLSNGDSKTYSTWRSSAGVVGFTPIFENLPHGDYTFEMEFLGDDPLNAPSGGTSRGWIRQAASDPSVKSIKFLAVNPLDYSSASDILTQDTIADFAILARPAGTSITSRWIPDHGVAGVSLGNQISVHVDGERILNSSTLVTTPYTACSDFLISQRFTANNPESGGGNMWDHFVSHSISLDMPWLSINNKLEFTADTRLSQTYLAMMAARKSRCQRFATSDRYIESAPFLDDNSEIALPIGNDSAMMSGVSTFDSNNWHGLISRVSSFQDANGLGNFWGSPENRLWYRSDDTLKFYWKAARFNTDVPAGTVMSCQNDLFVVAGVRFPNTQLRNVM